MTRLCSRSTVVPRRLAAKEFLLWCKSSCEASLISWTFHRRAGDMTTSRSPLSELAASLQLSCSDKQANLVLDELVAASVIDHACDLASLAASCHDPSNAVLARRMVSELVRLSNEYELAGIAAIVALRPGLEHLAAKLTRCGIELEEAEAEVIGFAFEAIRRLGDSRSPTPMHLIDLVWTKARTRLRRELRYRDRTRVIHRGENWGADVQDPALLVSTLLAEAVRAGVLSAEDAKLLYRTRVLDEPIGAQLAASPKNAAAFLQQRHRSERRLATYCRRTYRSEGSR